MTESDPESSGTSRRPARSKVASTVLWWLAPEENPAGLVYGTIAVGAVLAAESTRRDTFPDTVMATVLILALYWVAHAYAHLTGDRLRTRQEITAGGLWRSLVHEGAIVKGAVAPIAVLLVLWAADVSLNTAVTAALWTSAVLLALIEVAASFRSRISGSHRVAQILLGSFLGAGVLAVRALLH
jgi:hypothetical protein